MKKFNTRRRLIGAVLNAASSPKWALFNNDSLCDVDQFSDFNSDEGTSKGLFLKLFKFIFSTILLRRYLGSEKWRVKNFSKMIFFVFDFLWIIKLFFLITGLKMCIIGLWSSQKNEKSYYIPLNEISGFQIPFYQKYLFEHIFF